MKRILFYYDNYCDRSTQGGTEVATYRIGKALKESGEWEIFHAYLYKVPNPDKDFYTATIQLTKPEALFIHDLAKFISDNKIDVIVNEGKFFRHEKLRKSISKSGRDVKLFFMHHFAPGSEKKKSTFKAAWHLLKLNPYNPIYYLRWAFLPLVRLSRTLRWPQVYRQTYENSDRVVVLSEGYKEEYARIGGFEDLEKFAAIGNIFSNEGKDPAMKPKKKRVLVLSRMDEIQKRISYALKIWNIIEKDPSLDEWELDIVGDGHNMDIFKRLAKRLKLKRVTFHGWQPSEKYLEEDAILLSASDYEGLSLAMIEAQWKGCVPIAFNAYSSLKDVIEDGVNGVIVENRDDIKGFAEALKTLMKDDDLRSRMAKNGVESIEKFTAEKIVEKWLRILT